MDPKQQFVGGYVDFEWAHARHILECSGVPLAGKDVLEFGCNYGATAVVLALLGARVHAVDVDAGAVALARANAEKYRVAPAVHIQHLAEGHALPFAARRFDVAVCNSVLEYVRPELLPAVLAEIDRVLKPDGVLFVLGTSNRLWPREVHSRRWANWIPRAFDRWFQPSAPRQRGVFPWRIVRHLPNYEHLERAGGGRALIESRRRMGMPAHQVVTLRTAASLSALVGIPTGALLPSFGLTLRKPGVASPDAGAAAGR